MEGFRQQLIGYKSTITVALSFANLRASAHTAEAVQECRDLIATTTIDLEAHLQDIQDKMETLLMRTTDGPAPDTNLLQRMEEERRSTSKGLQFCAVLSQQIEQIQAELLEDAQSSSHLRDPKSTSRVLIGEGLEACRNHLRSTLDGLEKHQKGMETLGTDSGATVSAEDQTLYDKLQAEVNTVKQSLEFCADVDLVLESKISNIENDAEGDDTIQIMVSTDGNKINGKNRGIGQRLKQAGGHFSDTALQSVSQDFKTISLHQTRPKPPGRNQSAPATEADGASAGLDTPFGDRHGPGFSLAKHSTSSPPPTSIDT